MARFLNLDLELSPLVDFQEARLALKVELWLLLVLASVPHHLLVNIIVTCICSPFRFPFTVLGIDKQYSALSSKYQAIPL